MTRLRINQSETMEATLLYPTFLKQPFRPMTKEQDEDILGRTGLSGCVYKDSLYHFFGEIGYNQASNERAMTNEIV